mgnify:CR=1 FL=1
MNKSALEFAVFCIESVSLPGNQVYDMLTKQSNILYSYVIPSFDVLHTQGKNYIVDDLLSLMRERGVLP